jgi:hypothetical protein
VSLFYEKGRVEIVNSMHVYQGDAKKESQAYKKDKFTKKPRIRQRFWSSSGSDFVLILVVFADTHSSSVDIYK